MGESRWDCWRWRDANALVHQLCLLQGPSSKGAHLGLSPASRRWTSMPICPLPNNRLNRDDVIFYPRSLCWRSWWRETQLTRQTERGICGRHKHKSNECLPWYGNELQSLHYWCSHSFLEPRLRDSLCFSPLWMKRQRPKEFTQVSQPAWQNHGSRRHDVDSCCNMPTTSWQSEIIPLILYLFNSYHTTPFLCWFWRTWWTNQCGDLKSWWLQLSVWLDVRK